MSHQARLAPGCLLLVGVFVASSCRGADQSVRAPVAAGAFYPSNQAELRDMVDRYLAQGAKKAEAVKAKPLALIAPHAGYRYSGACAGVAYATVKGKTYRRVIVLAVKSRGRRIGGSSSLRSITAAGLSTAPRSSMSRLIAPRWAKSPSRPACARPCEGVS